MEGVQPAILKSSVIYLLCWPGALLVGKSEPGQFQFTEQGRPTTAPGVGVVVPPMDFRMNAQPLFVEPRILSL